MNNDLNISHFKQKLEEERVQLEEELKTVGRINPDNPADWEPLPEDEMDRTEVDKNDIADKIEDYEGNAAILRELEIRLLFVRTALQRIEEGTYGMCTEGGQNHPIPKERLEANPAAATCLEHAGSESN